MEGDLVRIPTFEFLEDGSQTDSSERSELLAVFLHNYLYNKVNFILSFL